MMENKNCKMRLKKINIGVAITDKTDVDQLADNIEKLVILLRKKGILEKPYTVNGVTVDDEGDGID
jgi:hypothetical protein